MKAGQFNRGAGSKSPCKWDLSIGIYSIVTFDALHTQKDTIAVIRGQKGDYVGGLKGNQSGLLEEAAAYFNEKELLGYYKDNGNFYESIEKAHGKFEHRAYYLERPTKRKIIKEWAGLKHFKKNSDGDLKTAFLFFFQASIKNRSEKH